MTFAYSEFRRQSGGLLHRHLHRDAEEQSRPGEAPGSDAQIFYKEAEGNPDQAIAAIADIVGGTMAEDQGKAQARAVLDMALGVLYSKANTDKKLGLHVASDWDDMLNLMKKYNDLQTDKPATAFYTNDYVK